MSRENRSIADPTTVAPGTSGPTLTVEDVTREDFVRYAGASGDFNPLHYDESYATDAGHSDVFAQGMFVAGIASRFVTDWVGVEPLARFRTRFTAQVWPGDTLTVSGEVTDKRTSDGKTTLEIDFDVSNQDGTDVLTGDATAVFPTSE